MTVIPPESVVEVTPTAMVAGGDAIARDVDGRVVFVEGAIPGEHVRAEVLSARKNHAMARVVEVLEPSAHRVAPPCPELARGCGACQWQHIEVGEQRSQKEQIVLDALRYHPSGSRTDNSTSASGFAADSSGQNDPPGQSTIAR